MHVLCEESRAFEEKASEKDVEYIEAKLRLGHAQQAYYILDARLTDLKKRRDAIERM